MEKVQEERVQMMVKYLKDLITHKNAANKCKGVDPYMYKNNLTKANSIKVELLNYQKKLTITERMWAEGVVYKELDLE